MENGIAEAVDIVIPKSKVNWKKELVKLSCVGLTALGGLAVLLYVKTSLLTILSSVFAIAAVAWLTEHDTRAPSRIPSAGKTVFITGCDTGPAQMLVKHLDDLGVTVFACVYDVTSHAAQCLTAQCSARLRLVELDTRQEKQVAQCAVAIKEVLNNFTRKSLWGLIVFTGAVPENDNESNPLDVFHANTQVNQLSSISVFHTFASLMRPFGGRMVHVDLDARVHRGGEMPAYSVVMSAVDTFLTLVRRELADLQVHVMSVKYFGSRLQIQQRDTKEDGDAPQLDTDGGTEGEAVHLEADSDTPQLETEGDVVDEGTEGTELGKDKFQRGKNRTSAPLSRSLQKAPEQTELFYQDLVKATTKALFDLKPRTRYQAGQQSFFHKLSLGWI